MVGALADTGRPARLVTPLFGHWPLTYLNQVGDFAHLIVGSVWQLDQAVRSISRLLLLLLILLRRLLMWLLLLVLLLFLLLCGQQVMRIALVRSHHWRLPVVLVVA